MDELTTYEYGAMSSLFSIQAKNKLTAYAVMCAHYGSNSHMVMIYEPQSSKEDVWNSIDGKISERLDKIFGGENSFDEYFEDNIEEIKICYNTIKRLS
ncbi:MAG: hypothetical protein H7Z76_13495 [Methylotenera sp.]|nr:hypothetical protein [Flavobacterium sp.]